MSEQMIGLLGNESVSGSEKVGVYEQKYNDMTENSPEISMVFHDYPADEGLFITSVQTPEWANKYRFQFNLNHEFMDHIYRVHIASHGSQFFCSYNQENFCLYLEDGAGREIMILPVDPRFPDTFIEAIDILENTVNILRGRVKNA